MPKKIWWNFTVTKVEENGSTFYFHLDKKVRYGCGETTKIRVTKHHPQFDFDLLTKEFKRFEIEVSGALNATSFDNVFDINRIRRPIVEMLEEELEAANEKIKDLENELEGEKEAAQTLFDTQLNHYRNQVLLAEIFAELEKRLGGKENVKAKNWLPNLIQLLQWKEQKAKNEKEQVEKQKSKKVKQKNQINSKYQQKIRRIKKLVGQNTYWTDQDNKLRDTIKDLQDQKTNHNCSGCHVSAHADYEQLKQDKQDLKDKLSKKRSSKKELNIKLKELEIDFKNQKEKLTTSQAQLTKLNQEKQNWQQREQELLTEIELLKNPPLTNSNKENIKQNTIVKEIIKEVIIKELVSNELGLNLSLEEKNKLETLPLQEVENYRSQIVKSKFNDLKSQVKQLTDKSNNLVNRERERETKFILLWLLIALLVIVNLSFVVKKIRRIKKSKKL